MYPKISLILLLISLLSACSSSDSGSNPSTGSVDGSPITPTNLTTTSENSRIIVKWDAVTDADSYTLAWSDTKDQTATGTTVEITDITEYTHEFLVDGKQRLTTGVPYFYSVTAVSSKGTSDPSTEVEGRLKNKPWLMPLLTSVISTN